MIDAISLETAHLLGDALPSAHRLRHRIFVGRQKYNVPALRGMEWDQFDTPAAVYMLWRDKSSDVRAIARLIPTTLPYMIQQLWPDLVSNGEMPAGDDVWEVTRLGVDRDLNAAQRVRILGELSCAVAEFGLKRCIRNYVFVTAQRIIDAALGRAGVAVERLAEPRPLGGLPVVAARSMVSYAALHKLRRYHGITGQVLCVGGEADAGAEAA